MTIHIGAKLGEIADTVLLPGDPLRAKWAAETFLDNPQCINQVRGMLGYTGTWHGNRVTIHGSGMGMPSLSIYVNELIKDYDVKTLIRVGSAGGMSTKVKLRDVVIAMTASSLSTPSMGMFKEINYAPCADFKLLEAAVIAARSRKIETHVAARYDRRALAVCTISDHLLTHEALPSEDRERSFGDMIEIALEAAFPKNNTNMHQ